MRKQLIGKYKGHNCFIDGISYDCPKLALYGFSSDIKLFNAIDRKLRKGKK